MPETTFDKITADEIRPGDCVARARTQPFSRVHEISTGPVAVRLIDRRGQTLARPRRTASWWRMNRDEEQAGLEALGLQALDAEIEALEHLTGPNSSTRSYMPEGIELRRRLDCAQAEWERRDKERAQQRAAAEREAEQAPLSGQHLIESWRIFDADEEEVTEEPVSESAAHKEFERTVALNPAGHFELHHRVAGGEWEVVS